MGCIRCSIEWFIDVGLRFANPTYENYVNLRRSKPFSRPEGTPNRTAAAGCNRRGRAKDGHWGYRIPCPDPWPREQIAPPW